MLHVTPIGLPEKELENKSMQGVGFKVHRKIEFKYPHQQVLKVEEVGLKFPIMRHNTWHPQ